MLTDGEFQSEQIGSFFSFAKSSDEFGVSLIGEARIPKRSAQLCETIMRMYEAGTLTFSFEIMATTVAVGDTIRVAYRRRVNGASLATVKTNSTTAKGSLYAHWPVYSSGTDCTESAIKGWLHLYVPRVRVTALPGFDNSYKSAATNGVTFAAIDPKRADEKMYDIYYEPLDADGQIVTTTTGDVKWN